jgi:hypothetical protein
MNVADHEFETTLGDELAIQDLANATYRVVETFVTFVDFELPHRVVFTHRVELHQTDDKLLANIPRG